MSTTLSAVPPATLADLERDPDSIASLRAESRFDTYLWTTLPYFLGGGEDDEEGDDEDLSAATALDGTRSVASRRLENGAFGVVDADEVPKLRDLLALVDVDALGAAIRAADLEDAADGEVWEELEQLDLTDADAAADQATADLRGLLAFYRRAASSGHAIVLVTG